MAECAATDTPKIGYGMKVIAAFFNISERKAYYLATGAHLPGVFQMGERGWAIDFDVAREEIRARAKGKVA